MVPRYPFVVMQHDFFITKVLRVHIFISYCIYWYLDLIAGKGHAALTRLCTCYPPVQMDGEAQASAATPRGIACCSTALLHLHVPKIFKSCLSYQSFKLPKCQGCRYCRIQTLEHLSLKVKMNETSTNPKAQ